MWRELRKDTPFNSIAAKKINNSKPVCHLLASLHVLMMFGESESYLLIMLKSKMKSDRKRGDFFLLSILSCCASWPIILPLRFGMKLNNQMKLFESNISLTEQKKIDKTLPSFMIKIKSFLSTPHYYEFACD